MIEQYDELLRLNSSPVIALNRAFVTWWVGADQYGGALLTGLFAVAIGWLPPNTQFFLGARYVVSSLLRLVPNALQTAMIGTFVYVAFRAIARRGWVGCDPSHAPAASPRAMAARMGARIFIVFPLRSLPQTASAPFGSSPNSGS